MDKNTLPVTTPVRVRVWFAARPAYLLIAFTLMATTHAAGVESELGLVRVQDGTALQEGAPSLEGDAEAIRLGERLYNVHCWQCHGTGGRGMIGPAFTDEETLHGDRYEDYVNVVTNGVRGKPMAAWKSRLPPQQILQVVAFIYNLKGTRPRPAE